MEIYEKIARIMCYEYEQGEDMEQVLLRNRFDIGSAPINIAISIVYAGGLQRWADAQDVESEAQLEKLLTDKCMIIVNDAKFNSKKYECPMPTVANLFAFMQTLDRRGKLFEECSLVAKLAWNGKICRRMIDERTRGMFASPDKEKYLKAVKRIKEVWFYSDIDIDALRYFVCQSRHENHNPSLNKGIYHWGSEKQTGKTTVAKTIVAILNGDILEHAGRYSSHLTVELQYGNHDIPKAALFNSVLLDEAAPKDSTKSYNAFKSVMTGNSCDYNPKYKQVLTIPCRRYYYFTSNDDIRDFVQDRRERRLYELKSTQKPLQISFEEIYRIWFDFCTNAEPESNWQAWYNSFVMVDGQAQKNIEEIKTELRIKGENIFAPLSGKYQITVKQVAMELYKNEPTASQKDYVRTAMRELFPDCTTTNQSIYSKSQCREVLAGMGEIETLTVGDDGMPF